jgi:hypothetical protein
MKNLLIVMLLFISISLFADGIPPFGIVTSGDPYQISTLENLRWVSTNDTSWSSYFIQTTDIDATYTQNWNSEAGFSSIGYDHFHSFIGNYDGDSYIISNLFINRPGTSFIGLFGYLVGGEVSNQSIENTDITGDYYLSALVGWNQDSFIENSFWDNHKF